MRDSLLKVAIDGPEVQQTINEMVSSKVAMTSTLAVYELSYPDRPPLEDRVLEALAPEAREEYLSARKETSAARGAVDDARSVPPRAGLRACVRESRRPAGRGRRSHRHAAARCPGFGDQRNYELLIEAGFSPVEAIQIMTLNGAKILGVDDRLGSVAAGKLADLVVIQGNPIATPAEIRKVTIVFKDGVGYDSAKAAGVGERARRDSLAGPQPIRRDLAFSVPIDELQLQNRMSFERDAHRLVSFAVRLAVNQHVTHADLLEIANRVRRGKRTLVGDEGQIGVRVMATVSVDQRLPMER